MSSVNSSSNVRPFQKIAREEKIAYFLPFISPGAKVLEIGSASQWFKEAALRVEGVQYTDIDLFPPADIVGSVLQWRELGLLENSFDVIVAFEVIEHVDCFAACHALLRPGGKLLLTTPVPHFDWVMKILEVLGLNQTRTSPHNNLTYLRKVNFSGKKEIKIVHFLAQWGVFTKQ